ncbi:hypothetical protein RYX36_026437, partial [Vicia faba]
DQYLLLFPSIFPQKTLSSNFSKNHKQKKNPYIFIKIITKPTRVRNQGTKTINLSDSHLATRQHSGGSPVRGAIGVRSGRQCSCGLLGGKLQTCGMCIVFDQRRVGGVLLFRKWCLCKVEEACAAVIWRCCRCCVRDQILCKLALKELFLERRSLPLCLYCEPTSVFVNESVVRRWRYGATKVCTQSSFRWHLNSDY